MAPEPSAHDALRESTGLYALGALMPEERAAFETHLATCAECAAEVRAFSTVAGALAQAAPQVNPPASLRERTLAATGLAEGPGLEAEPARARSVSAAGGAARTPWFAFAASVALAVGLSVYVLQLRERIATLEVRLREAVLRADAGERQFADARRVLADAQSRIAVMAAPDVARVNLAGRAAAPSAAARVFWSRSRGLLFTGSNLPPVPLGRVYRIWFISGQTPVSAGLILPGVSGQLDAILDVPVGIQAPAVVAVTVEPAGGAPAPTSEPFLVGSVQGS